MMIPAAAAAVVVTALSDIHSIEHNISRVHLGMVAVGA